MTALRQKSRGVSVDLAPLAAINAEVVQAPQGQYGAPGHSVAVVSAVPVAIWQVVKPMPSIVLPRHDGGPAREVGRR